MSKRNFILLIITLVAIIIGFFAFLYSRREVTPPTEAGPGTNFFSQFNPFSSGKPPPPADIPPVDVSGYEPDPEKQAGTKLIRVSSMPVAGYIVFQKERFKDIPPVIAPQESEIPAETPPVAPYNFGTATLKTGSSGDAVKEIQRFLNSALGLTLEMDGVLDAEVVAAIKQWQTENSLVSDGIVGAKTKALMYSSVNQKTGISEPAPPPTEFVPALRYVDRVTGNIYQTFADRIEERKFSSATIPKIHEAFFGGKGEFVIMRYLNADGRTVETFVGNLPQEHLGADATPEEINGSFLPRDVKDISISPGTESIFYLFITEDTMVGTTLNLSTNKKTQVFDSPFTEWLSFWPSGKLITLTTKPASGVPGYAYEMDQGGRNFGKILGGVNGLTTLASPDGSLVLYGNDRLALNSYEKETGASSTFGVRTLPEKCAWGRGGDVVYCSVPRAIPSAAYPDAWYQGEVSFSDRIWKINISTGTASMILDPVEATEGEEIDGIKLALDENEDYLFFVNKKDSLLWELQLK